MPSGRRSPTPILTAIVRVTAAPPAAGISWCWNGTTVRRTLGRSPASSSAICAWTTACRSVTSARPAMSHRPVSCAICSTRRSIHFGPPARRSRSAAMRPPGLKFCALSRASTSRVRSTVDPTTGPSGAGIESTLAKPNVSLDVPLLNNKPRGHARLDRQQRRHLVRAHSLAASREAQPRLSVGPARAVQAGRPSVVLDPAARVRLRHVVLAPAVQLVHPSAVLGPPVLRDRPVRLDRDQVARRGDGVARPILIKAAVSRSIERSGQ
jgi:hypothetical protein